MTKKMTVVSAIIVAIFTLIVFRPSFAQSVCGDGICDHPELFLNCPEDCRIPDHERIVLEEFYASTVGPNWNNNDGWLGVRGTECSWTGVICWDSLDPTNPGRLNVIGISLWSNNLTGQLPHQLTDLEFLDHLLLPDNRISGPLPDWLQNATGLKHLSLGNQFTGSIPTWIADLPNLEILGLGGNQFTGRIPPELGTGANRLKLRDIGLQLNQLTGPIPEQLGNLDNLILMDLTTNQLSCPIPSSIWGLPNLLILQAAENQLGSHQLPGTQCPELKENDLEGISQAQNLRVLGLGRNRLQGSLVEIGALNTNLENLGINGNAFTGRIPDSFQQLQLLDNGSDFGFNGLYIDDVNDPGLESFLKSKHNPSFGDWETTQTVAPSDLTCIRTAGDQATCSWTPIDYQQDEGGYCVYYGTESGGPYSLPEGEDPELCGPGYSLKALGKDSTTLIVPDLTPGETHHYVVRSFTMPHLPLNPNKVVSEASVEAPFVQLRGIEVTQGIQNLATPPGVPLIEERDTFAKVHLTAPDWLSPPSYLPDIRVRLVGPEGESAILLGPPKYNVFNADYARRDRGGALFKFPRSWLAGTIALRIELDAESPYPLVCPDGSPGPCMGFVSFESLLSLPPRVKVIPVTVVPLSRVPIYVPQPVVDFTIEILKSVLPLDTSVYHQYPPFVLNCLQPGGCDMRVLKSLDYYLYLTQPFLPQDKHIFLLPTQAVGGEPQGMARGSKNWAWAAVYPHLIMQNFDHLTAAHELSHLLGREHIRGEQSGPPPPPSQPCGNEPEPLDIHPYPGGHLGDPTAYNLDPWTPEHYFGFSSLDQATYAPDTTFDLMTYCLPRWISDYTYRDLGDTSALRVRAFSSTGSSLQTFAVVTGIADLDSGTGTIEEILVLDLPADTPEPEPGQWVLRFEDGVGSVVASHSFAPSTVTDGPETAIFGLAVPWDAAVERITLVSPQQGAVDSRGRSLNAPNVLIDYPNGGEALSGSSVTLIWSGTDADGDALSYSVLLSRDAGASWSTVASGLPNTSIDLDLGRVGGTDQGLIRVLATDGFSTSSDESDAAFEIAQASPFAFISQPLDGTVLSGDVQFLLMGTAYDPEEGYLASESLSWSSDLGGPLGEGDEVVLDVFALTEGWHTITLTAEDSTGAVGFADRRVLVSYTPAVFFDGFESGDTTAWSSAR